MTAAAAIRKLLEGMSPAQTATAVEVLLKAADLLEVDGWSQGAYGPESIGEVGCRCVYGALGAAAGIAPDEGTTDAERLFARYLSVDVYSGVAPWNDDPWQTCEGVVASLRGCASMVLETAERQVAA